MLLDGRPLAAYVRAYAAGGRVYAPVSPLLTSIADRAWLEGKSLVLERDGRRVRVELPAGAADQLDAAYVMVGPPLRALGASLRYEPSGHRLFVTTRAHGAVATPTPFNAAAPEVAPNPVFTPSAAETPRPVWSGSPLPRRTPLPAPQVSPGTRAATTGTIQTAYRCGSRTSAIIRSK